MPAATKSDCRETCDDSIPKESAECFVDPQAVTVDATAFAKCKYASHDQNRNQIEPVTNNN